MRRLQILNPDLSNNERTFLTAQYTTSDGTAISVKNTFAFSDDDFGVFGNPGEERTELKQIADADSSKTAMTLASALNFSHIQSTVLIRTYWNQVEVSRYRAAAWSVISTSGLQFDKQHTIYVDATGASTDSYRWRFKNSSSGEYSEYSPTFSGTGFTKDQVGFMVAEIRKVTNTENDQKTIQDKEIVRTLNTAQDIVYGVRKDWWFLRFPVDKSITTEASVFKYNLDLMGSGSAGSPASTHTLGFIKTVKYHFNDGTANHKYQLRFVSEVEFDDHDRDQTRQDDDNVSIYTIRPADTSSKNGYIEVYPTPKNTGNGTFEIEGFTKFAILDDFVDTTPIPIPSMIENFGIAFIERIRGNDAKAEYYETLFYGPAEKSQGKGNTRLTGISLLEQLNEQSRPTGQPRAFKRFRGQKAVSRLYGNRSSAANRDYVRINYF